ncbi:hypothetical protein [Hippea alviniae]|uniref:hypothetical protein n=1 Tax=Hippea alviniae TaxID=1279027 RepID=UPI0003B7236D|nr:hypothetical protein [Hippea alviniae]
MGSPQSEIDALIADFQKSDKNEVDSLIDDFAQQEGEKIELEKKKEVKTEKSVEDVEGEKLKGVRLPPQEHRVIDKLDEINKESEEKVNRLFEKLESISAEVDEIESLIENIKPFVKKHKEFMDFFVEHFPKTSIKNNYEYFKNIMNILDDIENKVNSVRDNTFEAMEILQFQDITRQKIERVISVIQALRDYLNNWFASSYDNVPRARVAHTIVDEKEKEKVDKEVEEIIKQMQRGEVK